MDDTKNESEGGKGESKEEARQDGEEKVKALKAVPGRTPESRVGLDRSTFLSRAGAEEGGWMEEGRSVEDVQGRRTGLKEKERGACKREEDRE